jgi:hypothetical protein
MGLDYEKTHAKSGGNQTKDYYAVGLLNGRLILHVHSFLYFTVYFMYNLLHAWIPRLWLPHSMATTRPPVESGLSGEGRVIYMCTVGYNDLEVWHT